MSLTMHNYNYCSREFKVAESGINITLLFLKNINSPLLCPHNLSTLIGDISRSASACQGRRHLGSTSVVSLLSTIKSSWFTGHTAPSVLREAVRLVCDAQPLHWAK